jgi:hypothetical protein
MKKFGIVSSALLFAVLCSTQASMADEPSQSVSIPADQIKYSDAGIGGPKLGVIWGDPTKGAYGAFLRLPKGYASPVHLHTYDYKGVIVEGTVTNAETGQPEIPLTPGSYFLQRGKADHVTACVGDKDCLIYIVQTEHLDFITHKK